MAFKDKCFELFAQVLLHPKPSTFGKPYVGELEKAGVQPPGLNFQSAL